MGDWHCVGTKADGSPCQAVAPWQTVDGVPDAYCLWHSPDPEAIAKREQARKGRPRIELPGGSIPTNIDEAAGDILAVAGAAKEAGRVREYAECMKVYLGLQQLRMQQSPKDQDAHGIRPIDDETVAIPIDLAKKFLPEVIFKHHMRSKETVTSTGQDGQPAAMKQADPPAHSQPARIDRPQPKRQDDRDDSPYAGLTEDEFIRKYGSPYSNDDDYMGDALLAVGRRLFGGGK
jgi:hypothetical protein